MNDLTPDEIETHVLQAQYGLAYSQHMLHSPAMQNDAHAQAVHRRNLENYQVTLERLEGREGYPDETACREAAGRGIERASRERRKVENHGFSAMGHH